MILIQPEDYKPFHGTMLITPVTKTVAPFEITSDWDYKLEYECWYGGGRSFPRKICKIVRREVEAC